MLYAKWPRLWTSHVRVTRRTTVPTDPPTKDPNEFAFRLSTIFPDGYGRDKSAYDIGGLGPSDFNARFVVESGKVVGFGLFNTTGKTTQAEKWGKTIREQADAWFDRV